ncbi:hypothetical protein ABK040_010963 [Willaertia magna]
MSGLNHSPPSSIRTLGLNVLLIVFSLFVMSVSCQLTIQPGVITIHRGDCINLNPTLLNVVGPSSSPQTVYNVFAIQNATIQRVNATLNAYVDVTSFTQDDVNTGIVRFCQNRFLRYPSLLLGAVNITTGVVSPNVSVPINFSMFRSSAVNYQVGAPIPDFNTCYSCVTSECYTFYIRMFRNWLQAPPAYHYLSLSDSNTCVTQDVINQPFFTTFNTTWYTDYAMQITLRELVNFPSTFLLQPSGPNIDVIANFTANYMMTDSSGNCQLVKYRFTYIIQMILEVTRVDFNISGGAGGNGNVRLLPNRLFVNDDLRLQLELTALLNITGDITNWVSSGPFPFIVNATPCATPIVGGSRCFNLVLLSNIITSAVDFWGSYVLSFTSSTAGVINIPYVMQYVVPYDPIQETLDFTTSAQTFSDPTFQNQTSQFDPNEERVYLRVIGNIPVELSTYSVSPYNVYFCCSTNPFANVSNTDCRTRSGFSDEAQFVNNGTATQAGAYDVQLLNSNIENSYGMSFSLLPTRAGDPSVSKRCFLTIESSLRESSKRKIEANTPVLGTYRSQTYRVLNVNGKRASTGNSSGGGGKKNSASTLKVSLLAFLLFIVNLLL